MAVRKTAALVVLDAAWRNAEPPPAPLLGRYVVPRELWPGICLRINTNVRGVRFAPSLVGAKPAGDGDLQEAREFGDWHVQDAAATSNMCCRIPIVK